MSKVPANDKSMRILGVLALKIHANIPKRREYKGEMYEGISFVEESTSQSNNICF